MSTDGHGFQLGVSYSRACTKTSGALLAGRLLQLRSTMLSRNTLPVLAIVVTSAAAGSKALPSTTQHGYPRRAFLTATAVALPCSLALAPCPAAAKLLNPAVTWTQQEQLMRTHAARFEQSTPVAVRTTSIARRRLRELVATVDLPVPPLLTCPPMLQPCHAYGLRAPASVPEARGSSCGPTPLAPGLTHCHALWPQAAPHTPWPGPHRPTLAWRSTRSRWWPTRRSTTTRTRWPSTGLRGRVASARLCRASRVSPPRPASHARSQAGLETGGQVAWPLSPLPRWRQPPECPPAAFLERNPRSRPGLSRSPPSSQRAPARLLRPASSPEARPLGGLGSAVQPVSEQPGAAWLRDE